MKRIDGLTLVELLLALAIIGLLAAIAVPNYLQYVERVKVELAIADIKGIEMTIQRYVTVSMSLPKNLAEIGEANLLDPWGHPYEFLNFEGLKGKGKMRKDKNLVPVNSDYDLYSMGPDGRTSAPFTAKAARDDIVRANNGRYVGPASEF
ncbi:prepilin-type N-terminal cleavage/methylation domain-containing protein [Pseudomonas sp.]|uniref:prepilin-type N-terminal cleavage/methylation domain-containing protein n=1 Tax=Pseudomonas sp. TaxID=306 RepID=UPI00299F22C3|nr:prepilin-type N-terminal cleavage/methylation domain-containing protein [Pseudomonas sp.]MDX1370042.1 prepilin-type N-terminal cleavage/methylation domain-containing protein [Pseudomonas sp.]